MRGLEVKKSEKFRKKRQTCTLGPFQALADFNRAVFCTVFWQVLLIVEFA